MNPLPAVPELRLPFADQPRVCLAARAPLDDRGFAVRYEGDNHALHLYDYHATMRLGRRSFRLQPGDVTLTPANVVSRYDLPRPGTHLVIHFESSPAPTGSSEAAGLPLHLSLGDERAGMEVRFMRIIHTYASADGDRLAEAATSASLQELLLGLAMLARRPPRPGGSTSDRAVQSAMELINRRLSQPLSVPDLARQVGLSQNYLARRFRERYGMTMQGYLMSQRIELARELLISTDLPIKAIGTRVGLPKPQHFNKQFRRCAGLSPTAMRERAGRSVV